MAILALCRSNKSKWKRTLRIGEGSRRRELSVPQPNNIKMDWVSFRPHTVRQPLETGGSFCLSACNWLLITIWSLIGQWWISRWGQYTHGKRSDMKSLSYPTKFCHKVFLSSCSSEKPWNNFLWSPKERSPLYEGPCTKHLLSPTNDAGGTKDGWKESLDN